MEAARSRRIRIMKNISTAIWIVPAAIIFVGLLPLPYGYYQSMRIVVCLASASILFFTFRGLRSQFWEGVFILVAILFNPIVPIYLTRPLWFWIDISVAGMFLAHLVFVRLRSFKKQTT
jgi:hypothetical protein